MSFRRASLRFNRGRVAFRRPPDTGGGPPPDTTDPVLQSAVVPIGAPNTIVLTYDEALDEASVPATAAYSATMSTGITRTITGVGVLGAVVTLTMSGSINTGAVVGVSYTAGASPIRDIALNEAANLVAQAVTNNSTADADLPGVSSLVVATDGTKLTITVDEACDTGSTPAVGAFSTSGTLATIATAAWTSTTTLDLTFTSGLRVTDFETVTISYTAGASPIQDAVGNDLPNFSNSAVTNNSEFLQGAVLILSLYRLASYILSGANITHLTNEATGTSHATTGSPQYVATGLNSRPSADFNGTTQYITSTDAAIRNALDEQAAHHFFAVAQFDSDDPAAANVLIGVGNPNSNNGRRAKLLSNVGAGVHRDFATNDAGTTVNVGGTDGEPDTSPHVYEWFGSTTTSMRRDGGALDINAAAWNPGTSTSSHWSVGARPSSTGYDGFLDGDLSYAVLFPSVLTTGTNSPANVRAYLYALSGLTGS